MRLFVLCFVAMAANSCIISSTEVAQLETMEKCVADIKAINVDALKLYEMFQTGDLNPTQIMIIALDLFTHVTSTQKNCMDVSVSEVYKFIMEHLNEDGKKCVVLMKDISEEVMTLFTKKDISYEEAMKLLKKIYEDLPPAIEICKRADINW